MFAEQAKDLDELEKHLPPQAVVILRKLFDPRNYLQHQGGMLVKAPPRPIQNAPGKLPNRPGQPGVPVFQAPGIQLQKDAVAQFDGDPRGVIRYAIVTADWTSKVNTKSKGDEYWVKARDCTQDGIRPTGPEFQMRCIMTGGQEPDIDVNDVLPYFYDIHGNAVTFPCTAQSYYTYAPTVSFTPPMLMASPAPEPSPELVPEPIYTASAVMPLRFPAVSTFNLIYHVYPSKKNDVWKRNLRQIVARADRFNGRKIFAIAESSETVPAKVVQESIDIPGSEYITLPNDRRLRETATFKPLLDAVASTDCTQATFYAHTKGNSNKNNDSLGMEFWRNAAYDALLEDMDIVRSRLRSCPALGINKIVWTKSNWSPFPSGIDPKYHWMFAGTYFWFRHDAVFNSQDWEKIANDRYGTEAWLAEMFPHDQCASLYQKWDENQFPTPTPYDPNLYSPQIYDHSFAVSVVIPCKGRLKDLRKAIPAWYSQTVQPFEVVVVDYGCPDGTQALVRELQPQYKRLRCVSVNEKGYNGSRARNLGAVRTLGNILAFGDADFFPKPSYLQEAWNLFKQDETLVTYRYFDGGEGGQCVVDAELYHKVNGYDESVPTYGHEDSDFYARCRAEGAGRGVILPAAAEGRGNNEEERMRFYEIKSTQESLRVSLDWMVNKSKTINPNGYGVIQ